MYLLEKRVRSSKTAIKRAIYVWSCVIHSGWLWSFTDANVGSKTVIMLYCHMQARLIPGLQSNQMLLMDFDDAEFTKGSHGFHCRSLGFLMS